MGQPLMTAEQVCEYLGIEMRTLKTMLLNRRLPIVKVGRLNRFRPEDLDAYVEAHLQPAAS